MQLCERASVEQDPKTSGCGYCGPKDAPISPWLLANRRRPGVSGNSPSRSSLASSMKLISKMSSASLLGPVPRQLLRTVPLLLRTLTFLCCLKCPQPSSCRESNYIVYVPRLARISKAAGIHKGKDISEVVSWCGIQPGTWGLHRFSRRLRGRSSVPVSRWGKPPCEVP
jgi:hypothetical protein